MPRSSIVTLPKHLLNVEDHVLRRPCSDVPVSSKAALQQCREIAVDMYYAMLSNCGTAIAGPQVGYTLNIIVVNDDERVSPSPLILLNPRIVSRSAEVEWGREVCLSIPGYEGQVERAKEIEITYYNLAGEEQRAHFVGHGARVMQHEIDHLEGRLFVDYSSTRDFQETAPGFWRRSEALVGRQVPETKV